MEDILVLEKEYSRFCGQDYGVACNSGTAALHLALMALEIGPGDEVILPDFTMAACGFAVAYTGATPVFVDCDERLNLDPHFLEEKITEKTKAIMVVHIYGRLCDMELIQTIAESYGIPIIEDNAEAQGAAKCTGTLTCHSFYKNKIIHGEEGGMVTTNIKELADDMRDLRCMAFGKKHNFFHERIGYNYRMPCSQARMIRESLANVEENLEKRRQVESWYQEYLGDMRPYRDVVWVYDRIGKKPNLPEARDFFKPLSSFPMFPESDSLKAYSASKAGHYLLVDPNMTKEEVKKICSKLV